MKCINAFKNMAIQFVFLMAVLVITVPIAWGYDPLANENLLLFNADGQVAATYHVNDFTQKAIPSGAGYKITSESYFPDVTQPPAVTTTYIPADGSTAAVPNRLNYTYPAPPAGIPDVSLFSFDSATLSLASSKPGINFSPSSGNYTQTLAVTIQAVPETAEVQYRKQGELLWSSSGTNMIRLFVYKNTNIELRAVISGPVYSDIITAVYEIKHPDGKNPEMVDSDNDGYPDCWEIENRMNPLLNETNKDSDNDGIVDVEEILRKSDPLDDGSLPLDTDGDGWSDFDEDLRGTAKDNDNSTPTARRLYEAERKLSGVFYSDAGMTVPSAAMSYNIGTFASTLLGKGTTDAGGNFGPDRFPVGEPALIRGSGVPHANFTLKAYIPQTKDLTPGDLTGTWNSASEWEALYIEMLKAKLVETVTGFQVSPFQAYPLALLERELEILKGFPAGIYLILSSTTHIPDLALLVNMKNLLALRNQDMNDHMKDLNGLLDKAALHTSLISDLNTIYANAKAEDAKTLEKQLADLYQGTLGRYLAGLMLAWNLDTLDNKVTGGITWSQILTPEGDMDGDTLPNNQEIPVSGNIERHSNPFHHDSDADGIHDAIDNCPTVFNPGQMDWDSDGLGDACDPDSDNDGLDDGTETAFGSNTHNTDTDGDGLNDFQEWLTYGDPGVYVTIYPVASSTALTSLILSGEIETGGSVGISVDTGATSGTVVYPDAASWQVLISDLMPGNNCITVHAANNGRTGSAFESVFVTDSPSEPGDLNGDSIIDLQDAVIMLQLLTGISSSEAFETDADIDENLKMGIPELIYVLQKVAGLR